MPTTYTVSFSAASSFLLFLTDDQRNKGGPYIVCFIRLDHSISSIRPGQDKVTACGHFFFDKG
jgi:hypothetical protein